MLLDGISINNHLRFVRKIGAGTYGLIYLVEDILSGAQYAAKIVLKTPPIAQGANKDVAHNKKIIQMKIVDYFYNHTNIVAHEADLDRLMTEGLNIPYLREIALHLKVHKHPNVVSIHHVLDIDDLAVVILMDYMEQGDLFNNIIDHQIFFNHTADQYRQQLMMKNVMLQLIDVIDYCHSQSIYHCDLKPENIMIRYNKNYQRDLSGQIIDYNEIQIVLIDFGLAMSSNLICCNACRGSSFYMAPERITNYNTNKLIKSLIDVSQFKSIPCNPNSIVNDSNSKFLPTLAGDIWSLGVLFLNITCARNPWPIASIVDTDSSNNDVFKSYMLHNNRNILRTILPISMEFNRLLDKIFQLNPNSRISLGSLRRHVVSVDFFNDHVHQTTETSQFNTQLFTPSETQKFVSALTIHSCDDDEDDVEEDDKEDDDEDDDEDNGDVADDFDVGDVNNDDDEIDDELDDESASEEYSYHASAPSVHNLQTVSKSVSKSVSYLELCNNQVKIYNCPFHHFENQNV